MPNNKEAPTMTEEEKRSKDTLALIISLVFVAIIGVLGYNYFNNPNNFDYSEDDISSASTERGTENESKESVPDEELALAMKENGSDTSVLGSSEEYVNIWTANDYNEGDIQAGEYKVQSGDTLWEIAEAVYGNGADWVQILNANVDSIGFMPNGQQSLIYSGQTLVIPSMN